MLKSRHEVCQQRCPPIRKQIGNYGRFGADELDNGRTHNMVKLAQPATRMQRPVGVFADAAM